MAENILFKVTTKSITRVNANFYISDEFYKSNSEEDTRIVHTA